MQTPESYRAQSSEGTTPVTTRRRRWGTEKQIISWQEPSDKAGFCKCDIGPTTLDDRL
jgi:hypothetical protein